MAAQRKFGFNAGYDAFTGVVGFNIDEITTYFTYGGKDWLLEFWKGEYEVVTLGGEIGSDYADPYGQGRIVAVEEAP